MEQIQLNADFGVPVEMYKCNPEFLYQAQQAVWDVELGIKHDRPPVSDEEVLSYLTETNKKREIDNPDLPPYDPRSGF